VGGFSEGTGYVVERGGCVVEEVVVLLKRVVVLLPGIRGFAAGTAFYIKMSATSGYLVYRGALISVRRSLVCERKRLVELF